jgi:hypothetical protein
MSVTASELRSRIYHLLDEVAATGRPLVIERKGRKLQVVCEETPGRLSRLVRRDCIPGDPEQLVHMDWSKEWRDALP